MVTSECDSGAGSTGKSDDMKKPDMTNPMELPIDNVKAKLKVFEALSLSKTDLSNSSPLGGKSTKGTNKSGQAEKIERAENNVRTQSTAGNDDTTGIHSPKQSGEPALCQNKIGEDGSLLSLRLNGCNFGEGSHDGNTLGLRHASTHLGHIESGVKLEKPDQVLGIDSNRLGNNRLDDTAKDCAECHPSDLTQSNRRKFAEVTCKSEESSQTQRRPCMGKDIQKAVEAIQEPINTVRGDDIVDLHLEEKILVGVSKVETGMQEVLGYNFEQKNVNKYSSTQSVSPLNEIQIVRHGSPSQYRKSSAGKENRAGKSRKSFGNVKIEDIKESIAANTPKKEITIRSRKSFSKIPTDIVAKRVSKLTSTPENP